MKINAVSIIAVLGIATFANCLLNPFVWDDHDYIINNPATRTLNILTFFGENIFNNTNQYRPLVVAYFAILYNIFGTSQFFYHFIQVGLHLINTYLLFILFKSFFNKKLALFLALIFLVHPMQVESVSYISASGGTLLFLFGISTLLIMRSNRSTIKASLAGQVLLLSSILAKETGILFYPLVLLYKFLFSKNGVVKSCIFSAVSLLAYFLLRSFIGNVSLETRLMIPIARADFTERMINIPNVLFYYIKTFFFPMTLAIDQQWIVKSLNFKEFYFPLFIDISFFSAIIFFGYILYMQKSKYLPIYFFFSLWFLMGLALHSQIIPLDMTVADRWFYFDMAGLLGIIGTAIQANITLIKKYNVILFIIAGISIIGLMTRTIIRNNDWNNPTDLYKHDIAISDNYLLQEELALQFVREGKFKEALIPAKKSVAYFPTDLNLYNLGYIYERMGNIKQAKQEYMKAMQAKNFLPWKHRHYLAVYTRLGNILVTQDEPEYAKKFLTDALQDYPDSARLWFLLALTEYKLQHQDAAISFAEKAVRLAPDDPIMNNIYQRLLNNLSIEIRY